MGNGALYMEDELRKKECKRIVKRENYHKNLEKYRANHRLRAEKYRKRDKEEYNNYLYIHIWVRKNKKKQDYCSICNEPKRVELSNISGEYKRDVLDYWWLCSECHALFDILNKTHKKVV